MSINPINSFQQYQHPKKHKTLTPVSITGYAAITCGVGSVISAKTKNIKTHKDLGYAAGLFTLAHLIAIKLKHKKRTYK